MFSINQNIYFYLDYANPCQLGKIIGIINKPDIYYEIETPDGADIGDIYFGSYQVFEKDVFRTESECMAYAQTMRTNLINQFKSDIDSKEYILRHLYKFFQDSHYKCDIEKTALKERIEELFGIRV